MNLKPKSRLIISRKICVSQQDDQIHLDDEKQQQQ